MESYDFIDNIKTEKANAIARYQTFTNISKLIHTIELLVFVTLISWSSTHLLYVLNLFCQYLTSLSSYFNNQHIVFVIGNLIVLACYVLSRYSDSCHDSVSSDSLSDVANGNGNGSLTHRKISSDDLMTSAKPSEIQIPMSLSSKSEFKVVGETEIKAETKRIERFQRTRSEKVKRKIQVKADRELRRSVTEMRRSVAGSSGREEAVEKMSNEEFRVAVEKFILKQQRFLKEQLSMVEDD